MADAALERAAALFRAGKLEEARAIGLVLVASKPTDFYALHLLGALAVRMGEPAQAVEYETRALQSRPEDAEALCNRGIALRALDRIDAAIADYDRVLARNPRFAPALNLKGVALAAVNRHEEAIATYSQAVASQPSFAPAYFNRSFSYLALGDYERGWRDFEWRWTGSDTQIAKRDFGRPHWQGEALAGRTLLVHAEQGFGDALQFCRYVPLAAARGGRVILETQPALAGLFAGLEGVERVVPMGDALPAFDLQIPLLSLPLTFGTRVETIPSLVPYLHAPKEHVDACAARLGAKTRPRVGIAWAGNMRQQNDRNRSMPLAALRALRAGPWELLSLQKETRLRDAEALAANPPIRRFDDELRDFRDTAALIHHMDAVVSVDTSVAHLAGAMGKPLFVMLTHAADWRWHLDPTRSPWYPTATLIRQAAPGEWEAVAEAAARQLHARLGLA
jgi:tetratricopeptide (TPR) repeat protein